MDKNELRGVIEETVKKMLKEGVDLDYLTDDLNSSSEIAKAYIQAVNALSYLIMEVDGFNESFASALHKQGIREKIPTATYVQQLMQVVKLLEQLQKPVKFMSEVERRDMY